MNELDNKGKKIDLTLYGVSGLDARTIDVTYIPCVPKQLTPQNKHLVDKECIADLKSPKALEKKFQESKAYLGRP